MSDTKSPAEQPAALKELTSAEAAKRVQRKVVERVEAKGEDGKPVAQVREKRVPVKADEVLSFRDYGTYVVVVTRDGQKLSSLDSGSRGAMIKLLPAGTGYARLSEAVTTEYGQLIDLVRQAVRDKLRLTANSDYYVDVRGIWPERVVVGFKGRLYSYPYTIGQDNTVAVGDAAEVVAEYNPVGAASAPAAAPAGDVAVREAAAQDVTAQFREAKDGSIEVTLIRAGRSGNRNYYPDATLREAAAMFDGVRVFAKSDADHIAGKGQGRPQPDRRHLRCAVRGGPDARHGRSGGHVQAPQPQRCRGHEDDRGRQARDAEPAGPVHRCHRTHQAAKGGCRATARGSEVPQGGLRRSDRRAGRWWRPGSPRRSRHRFDQLSRNRNASLEATHAGGHQGQKTR